MAVTLTVEELSNALRLSDSPEELAEATRLLEYATEAVTKHAPGAPDTAHNEAAIRLAGYLFDAPNAGRGLSFAHAGRNSGAWAILLPHRIHRAGSTTEAIAAAQVAVGTVGNPVIAVSISGGVLTVEFSDGTITTDSFSSAVVDQTARDSASQAEASAQHAESAADANTVEINALTHPADWAEENNTDLIPPTKFSGTIRGTKVFVSTSVPADGLDGDIWLQDLTTATPKIYEHNGSTWVLDFAFHGGRVHYQSSAFDTAANLPDANSGDVMLELVSGTLKLYRRLSTATTPFWRLLGTVAGGGGGGGTNTDQTARDAAIAAQDTADGAVTDAATAQERADNAFTAAGLAHNQANVAANNAGTAQALAGDAYTKAEEAESVAATKDDAFPWATEGNSTLLPAAKIPLALDDTRGAVAGIATNSIIDAGTDALIRGWSVGNLVRLVSARVKAYAREGANTLIDPEDIFGTNHATNRLVAISTEGDFQLIEGGTQGGGGDSESSDPIVLLDDAAVSPGSFSQGWAEVTLTEDIVSGQLIEFWLAGSGVGAGSYGLAVSDSILKTTPTGDRPTGYTGALPVKVMDLRNGGFGHDTLLIQQSDDLSKLWVKTGRSLSADWTITAYPIGGSGGGGGSTAGEILGVVVANVSAWAIHGNASSIPYGKMPFVLPSYILDPLSHPDIPYSALDGTLESWAVKDASPPVEIIPNERLPVARFLPSPTALADGLVATIASGAWTASPSAGGSSTTAKQWRFDFVRGEDTADPIAAAGMVFIELRYLDSYNSMGVRTNVQDVGAGFLSADGSRVLSSSAALDVKGLLAQASVSAVMQLITNLPTSGNATWGEWYGLADTQGRVKDVYYRREESRTEQLWLPARLNAQNRNLHGFSTLNSTLTYGYQRGGALSPEAGIVELVEELDAGGNYTTRVLVPNDGPLNSAISVILFWKSDGESSYTTSRELPLFHDTSFLSSETNRYVSAVYTDAFKFDPGRAYTIKWRDAGQVHDLIIQPSEALRRVVDEEELAESVTKILRELYATEDRVAALESAPATPGGGGGGGIPTVVVTEITMTTGTFATLGGGRTLTASYPTGLTRADFQSRVVDAHIFASVTSHFPQGSRVLTLSGDGFWLSEGGSGTQWNVLLRDNGVRLFIPFAVPETNVTAATVYLARLT